jgi:outer membrane protein assembly factor BamB
MYMLNRIPVYLFLLALGIGMMLPELNAQEAEFKSSGDEELDRIRTEIRTQPTNRSNFELRTLKMKLWVVTLQQQGASLEAYLPVDESLRKDVWWNTIDRNQGKSQPFTEKQMERLSLAVDRGYVILDSIQNALDSQVTSLIKSTATRGLDAATQPEIPWTHYKGNAGLTGYSGALGPVLGEKAWTFPVGLSWESQAVIEGDRVYLSSPGMRTLMWCLDLESGEEIWHSNQVVEIMGDQLYNTPNNQSTPVVLDKYIMYRELGARGNKGPSKDIVWIDKSTGKLARSMVAGHVDYRAGNAPFTANEQYTVFTHGTQDIHESPAIGQGFNRVICCDTRTGNKLWEYNVGFTFAAPLLDDKHIFVGTQTGYLYAFDADQWYGHSRKAKWQFRADGAINRKAEVAGDKVYFGANDGYLYCLNKHTGELSWKTQTKHEPNAFRHFSTPFVSEDLVVAGSASREVYALDRQSGAIRFVIESDDWVRSRPVVQKEQLFFATMKGSLYAYEIHGKKPNEIFQLTLGRHPVLADLSIQGDKLVINDSDLFCHCVSTDGTLLWKKSIIRGFMKDGERILSDQIAGGAYYQSKPTAVNGLVYFGSPARFVYAVDAETGTEKWKFELGGSISGAPTYDQGRIYIGQQGAEEEFYCLDAETGREIWNQKTGWVWGSATVSDGLVFVPGIDGYVMALDAKNGQMVWRHRFHMSVCSEPCVEGDQVIFGSWDNYMIAFDKYTGKVNWQFQGGATDSGVSIVKNGRIYSKNKCIDAQTGELIWEFKDGNSVFNITPAIHDGKVYLSCWHGLGLGGICVEAVIYCVDAVTGELIWTHLGGGLSSPVIDADCVYFPSIADPYFYCVDTDGNGDGSTTCRWMYKMGNKVEESTPAIYKGKIYIMSSDGYVHAIR